ncbi:MAG TPA: aminotransferase class III-fold pyridoxal phosphate-dependent enzyme, partial [Candidatus Limnocylindrales bacterium]|nr:aminotransferase class III-fold pyridoxal phosphate-dependent enzyme [Candidatus Limnocylindrales bacterium]
GYSRSDLARALSESASLLPFARPATFDSEASEAYARELLDAAGPPYTRAIFTSSGSEAVEVALKAAYRYQRAVGRPERTRFARFRGHFHGGTVAALGVTDVRSRRAPYEPLLNEGMPALEPRGGPSLEEDLGDAAALIAETIPAAGLGAPVPPPGFLAGIRQACDARGALWIADEVLTGFARTGSLFAWKRLAERSEDAGVAPDIVAFGKGAGAGYAALGGILIAERVAAALDSAADGPFTHAQTYGGHAIACAVGRRVLAALREEKIEERVREKETLLREALAPLSAHPHVRAVHGIGFLWGVTLRADRATGAPFPRELRIAERVEALCREGGLLIFSGSGSADGERGDHLLLGPPLVSDPHHMAQIAIGLRQALDAATAGKR